MSLEQVNLTHKSSEKTSFCNQWSLPLLVRGMQVWGISALASFVWTAGCCLDLPFPLVPPSGQNLHMLPRWRSLNEHKGLSWLSGWEMIHPQRKPIWIWCFFIGLFCSTIHRTSFKIAISFEWCIHTIVAGREKNMSPLIATSSKWMHWQRGVLTPLQFWILLGETT